MSDEEIRECICAAGSDGEACECRYQTVDTTPENWVAFDRQKPYIYFDPSDEDVIFVRELSKFGTCHPENYF